MSECTYRVTICTGETMNDDELSKVVVGVEAVQDYVALLYAKQNSCYSSGHGLLAAMLAYPGDAEEFARLSISVWDGENIDLEFYGEFTIAVKKWA
jgi:hypothetical protein